MITLLMTGFLISFLGSLPLGVLNISASQIAVSQHFKKVILFVLGVVLIEYFQAAVSFLLVKWLTRTPTLEIWFHISAIVIFAIMGWYYLKPSKTARPSTIISNNYFLKGVFLSALNPLAYPFWAINIALFFPKSAYQLPLQNAFLVGIVLGTSGALILYGLVGRISRGKIGRFQHVFRYVIGSIFLVLALVELIRVIQGL